MFMIITWLFYNGKLKIRMGENVKTNPSESFRSNKKLTD